MYRLYTLPYQFLTSSRNTANYHRLSSQWVDKTDFWQGDHTHYMSPSNKWDKTSSVDNVIKIYPYQSLGHTETKFSDSTICHNSNYYWYTSLTCAVYMCQPELYCIFKIDECWPVHNLSTHVHTCHLWSASELHLLENTDNIQLQQHCQYNEHTSMELVWST